MRTKARIPKTCQNPACGKAFEVFPSRATAKYCSTACMHAGSRGKPRTFTPESRARLTGRPRGSGVETRTCPMCPAEFTLSAWDPKKFCSTQCYSAWRKGQRSPQNRQVAKTCPVCKTDFNVPPSQDRRTCCSKRCAAAYKRQGNLQKLNQMTEAQVAWLAGVFDGEGSIILSQRRRSPTGYVRVTISNTVFPLLEQVIKVTGVGSITTVHRSKRNPRHLDSHTWHAAGEYTLELIRQMRPWLIAKAERADAVLAGETFPRQARWDRIYPEGCDHLIQRSFPPRKAPVIS